MPPLWFKLLCTSGISNLDENMLPLCLQGPPIHSIQVEVYVASITSVTFWASLIQIHYLYESESFYLLLKVFEGHYLKIAVKKNSRDLTKVISILNYRSQD